MFKKLIVPLLLLFASTANAVDVKISQLPLGTAASATPQDVYPYVSYPTQVTKKMALYDLVNLPIMISTYAKLASPTFTGTVTAPLFVGSLTGNVSGNVSGTSYNVTGVVVASNGGTGISSYTLGDTLAASTPSLLVKVAGNTTTTKKFLTQTGTGSVSALPTWGVVTIADVASGILPVSQGGTGLNASSSSGLMRFSAGTPTISSLVNTDVSSTAAIAYSKLNLTTSIVDGDIAAAASIARSKLAPGAANQVVINSGAGAFTSEATLALSRGGTAQDNSSLTFPTTGTIPAITPNNHGVLVSGSGAATTVVAPGTVSLPLVSRGASFDPIYSALTVSGGGLGMTSGTSGGIPYYSSTSAMGSSALLTQRGVMVGGGAANTPYTIPVGTTGQVLTGVTGGDPVFTAPAAVSAPAYASYIANATYTTPSWAHFLIVRCAGAGGGGGGSRNINGTSGGTGGTGGSSTFGSNLTAAGGGGGTQSVAGTGGAATVTSPFTDCGSATGFDGGVSGSQLIGLAGALSAGAMGGGNPWLAGGAQTSGGDGSNGSPNTGGGGGGSAVVAGDGANQQRIGGSGGGGAYACAIVPPPLSVSYPVTIGTGGSRGAAGASGNQGGIGANGRCDVWTY